jgi:hypothetical protein
MVVGNPPGFDCEASMLNMHALHIRLICPSFAAALKEQRGAAF